MVEDDRYEALLAKKKKAQLTKFGDVAGALNPWLHEEARKTRRHKGSKAHRHKERNG